MSELKIQPQERFAVCDNLDGIKPKFRVKRHRGCTISKLRYNLAVVDEDINRCGFGGIVKKTEHSITIIMLYRII